jgi:hypothetical protein
MKLLVMNIRANHWNIRQDANECGQKRSESNTGSGLCTPPRPAWFDAAPQYPSS